MILLDTHVWFWWNTNHPRLTEEHREAISAARAADDVIAVSVISCLEIGIAASKNRITLDGPVEDWVAAALAPSGVTLLPLTPKIALASCNLPGTMHGDPFDRIIAATARFHGGRLLTVDRKLLTYEHVQTDGKAG